MLTLYHSPGACSMVPHIVLEELGASYDSVRVVLANREHDRPEFKAINPRGRVPVLVDGDFVLTENIAILAYFGRLWPAAPIFALDDAALHARMTEFLSFAASSVHIAFAQYWRMERFVTDQSLYPAVQESGRINLAGYFGDIERMIGEHDYIAGDRYTAADPYLLTFYRWGVRIGFDMKAHAAWTAHTERLLARPAVQRVFADEQIIIG